MKRKILTVIYIILLVISIKLILNIVLNSTLINKYNKGEYSENEAKILSTVNFPESYIASYNYGNIFYKKGEYEQAIEKYEEALSGYVPKDKECSIRINYALAICKTVQVDETSEESVKQAIETYEQAIDVLTENGCANKNDDKGHSKQAEQLKKDIQKEIERLKNLQKKGSSDKKDNEEEKKEEQKKEEKEKKDPIEEKIQDIKEDATKEQRETEQLYKDFNKDFTNLDKKNW